MKNDDSIYILGFGLSGYRSFGAKLQRIGPCQKINLMIGQNNSGKSNVLRFVHERYARLITRTDWKLEKLEIHQPPESAPCALSLAFNVSNEQIETWKKRGQNPPDDTERGVRRVLGAITRDKCGNGFWIDFTVPAPGDGPLIRREFFAGLAREAGFAQVCQTLNMNVQKSSRQGDGIEIIAQTVQWMLGDLARKVQCVKIPSLRSPGTSEWRADDFSGAGIVQRIAQLQNPDHDRQDLRDGFEQITQFLCEVTERSNARLEVPFSRKTINVHMDGRSMPLEALGTGIHEVIILAAAATSLHNHVICIEEPEIHLHPLLQKKLLRYLDAKTDNQYFISTHSAHFLDHPGAAIFHVQLTDEGSVVTRATEASERFAICTDLGYRASDLLQTNCVVWVEGPSDRVYLREWIRLRDPDFEEGIDYSIMFYGGRLLSHLTPSDPEVTEFISLRRLNRNMVIVMDSDRDQPETELNPTKERIIKEWAGQSGFAWVTNGREIENYVEPDAMLEARRTCAPKWDHQPVKSPYDRCIALDSSRKAVADKVKVARWLADNKKLTLSRLDLGEKIDRLCEFIQTSNHSVSLKQSPEN